MIETHPFGNFIPRDIKYLLLGSFISNMQVRGTLYDWYYGSTRNQFWPIISEVYNLPLETKEKRQALFEKLHIGIGDIIYQCERRDNNSLDANLINIVYNPNLKDILAAHKLKKIFFSSRFVETQYRKIFKDLVKEYPDIELITLPSPSPRYAAISKAEKVKRYKELLPELN